MDYQYLIALALIEQGTKRLMPLGGKSSTETLSNSELDKEMGEDLVKQLLMRVFQTSEELAIKRSYGDKSLILIKIKMELMQEEIPKIKARWLASGNSEKFISELKDVSTAIWNVIYTKGKGISFLKLK
ncbi:hypothetical protein [Prochlorococcus marinus]|uniref:hypothetical protein n=1 Tax=Prochlorococcus marinus TaxID=1219 RepID=UPI0022B2B04E|nr:hypothetical protein [Prochlorococcus marinus]